MAPLGEEPGDVFFRNARAGMAGSSGRVAVFDVGGTYIKYGVVTDGKLGDMGRVPTPQDGQESFLAAIDGVLERMGGAAALDGVAFSMPGVIDVDRRYLFVGGSLRYNDKTDIAAWEERFGVPVEVENDARSGALAELKLGSMQGVQTGLVVTFGTGTGGGVIVDGHVHKGGHLIAGEVSIVYSDDPALGSHAMLGYVGGVNNIAKAIGEAVGADITRGEEAFKYIEAEDERAWAAFNDRCDKIVRTFFNFQMLLDPERIAIGGGISANPLFIKGIQDATDRLYGGYPIPVPHAEIVPCRFRNAANLIGAYLHFAAKRGLAEELEIEGVA